MKKILSLSTVLIPLIITNGANAAEYQNKLFIGASANAVSVDSTFKDDVYEYVNIGGNESAFGGSVNAGYKMYLSQNGNNSFFITPEISWNFTSIEKTNNLTEYYSSFTEYSYNKYEVKPMFAFDLAFGYEFNQKHSMFAGLGLQYAKYEYNEGYDDYSVSTGALEDSYNFSKSGSQLGSRIFVGYEYNLTKSISFNTKLAASYIEPTIVNDLKAETSIVDFSLGVKYNF